MKVHFVTPTRISLINLTTIGDSEKREDETKIGKFSSGQAYATALLLRDNVGIEINIYGGYCTESEKYTEHITYNTSKRVCDSTNKSKEVIVIEYEKQFHGDCSSVHSFREGHSEYETIETAFALQLGYNWNTWMAYRELMSNVLDEGGYVLEQENYPEPESGTVITLTFDESNEFFNVWKNRHLYMNFEEPAFIVSPSVEALENEEGFLRIYKQNILVYQDQKVPSRFAWNIKFGEIDERRILNDVYGVSQKIVSAIQMTDNTEFLREIISIDFEDIENEFLSDVGYYSDYISDAVKQVSQQVYETYGDVKTYTWLLNKIRKQHDCKIPGKKIQSISDSLWGYSTEVTVETKPEVIAEPAVTIEDVEYISAFEAEINKYYNFKLNVEVRAAKLRGNKVIADKFEKCIIVDENFNAQEDFHLFLVEYFDLTKKDNVIKSLANYICQLIKK